jgi:hypothetical protein
MRSSWEETKAKSNYHFDNFKNDPQVDKVTHMGRFLAEDRFKAELDTIIKGAKPATWETRGYKGEGNIQPREDLVAEENDLEAQGYGKDYVITHMNWHISPRLKEISNLFGLADCMERIHVQMPGEVWNLHIDKLNKWSPQEPWNVMRIFVQLSDWEPGHFWSFGNYNLAQWRAGDIYTFDWQNIPHCTANAGHNPRVTFQITGVKTEVTDEFLKRLDRFKMHTLS